LGLIAKSCSSSPERRLRRIRGSLLMMSRERNVDLFIITVFLISSDTAFPEVMVQCTMNRELSDGTGDRNDLRGIATKRSIT
jgi:hypothetical protein